eukprot:m.485507 g.485507  ORF g.485507 m.485507 type:complete len:429 (+) comp23858_c0_seq1:242-1528(+)
MAEAAAADIAERLGRSKKRKRLLGREFGQVDGKLAVVHTRSTVGQTRKFVAADHAYLIDDGDLTASQPQNEDEEIYSDSKVFLKGLQSENPHNDYVQNFIDTGRRPQNFVREPSIEQRFSGCPKLKQLVDLKDALVRERNPPPMYIQSDLKDFDFRSLGQQFDVIYVDPPLPEYERRAPGFPFPGRTWSWNEIRDLKLEKAGNTPSFIFMWVGAGEGLDKGRDALRKWGYRRCEDICWIKTNRTCPGPTTTFQESAVFQRTKEHCLMGIKGTVKRSTDGHFIHANVDVDIIIGEELPYGSREKPEEIFKIMEHFCLGRRRLHVFGQDDTIRPGWLSVGPQLSSTSFDKDEYAENFAGNPPVTIDGLPSGLENRSNALVGCWPMIETLRPKSPPPRAEGGARGRGRGRGRGGARGRGRGGKKGRGRGRR